MKALDFYGSWRTCLCANPAGVRRRFTFLHLWKCFRIYLNIFNRLVETDCSKNPSIENARESRPVMADFIGHVYIYLFTSFLLKKNINIYIFFEFC